MRTGNLPRESILATLPIAIYIIGLVVSWLWSPVIFEHVEYPVVGLVVLAILAVGAAWGVAQRLPVSSYTWVIFFLAELGRLAGAYFADFADSAFDFGVGVSLGNLGAFLAVIAVAVFLSFRGMRFALFAILLSLLYGALRFPILEDTPALSSSAASAATWVFAILAVAEAGAAAFIVARFLSVRGKTQVRLLYLLAVIVFVDPLLNGWSISLSVSGGSFLNTLVAAIASIGGAWVFTGITLLLVWGFSKFVLRLLGRRVMAASP